MKLSKTGKGLGKNYYNKNHNQGTNIIIINNNIIGTSK